MPCRIIVFSGRKGEKAKRRHAKTRQMVTFSCFRMAIFRPTTRKYDIFHASPFRLLFVVDLIFAWRGERSPRENPPKSPFGVFSRGDLSPRQAKTPQSVGENATRRMSRTFVWRGERSPCENTKKSPFGGVLRGAFSRFRPKNTLIRHGTNQPPYTCEDANSMIS